MIVPNLLYFDFKNARHLVLAAVLLTIDFAACYYIISNLWPSDGLAASCTSVTTTFPNALYFSIATETTLGYGDVSALGWSRCLACIQVILGLILAGAGVARVTSLPGGKWRPIIQRAAGDWIEFAEIGSMKMVALATIAFTGDVLRYDGDNFDSNGKLLGFFKSEFTDVDTSGTILTFAYSNRESATEHFTAGVGSSRFMGPSLFGKWNRMNSLCNDEEHGTLTYRSIRATDEESRIIHANSPEADLERRELVRRHARTHFGVAED